MITEKEMNKITTLGNNNYGLIVVRMRESGSPILRPSLDSGHLLSQGGCTLVLDGINDPGNLGTIIRTADWYGITHIVCSLDTVDYYSTKVIMATMGSFTRVTVEYRDLEEYFLELLEKGGAESEG